MLLQATLTYTRCAYIYRQMNKRRRPGPMSSAVATRTRAVVEPCPPPPYSPLPIPSMQTQPSQLTAGNQYAAIYDRISTVESGLPPPYPGRDDGATAGPSSPTASPPAGTAWPAETAVGECPEDPPYYEATIGQAYLTMELPAPAAADDGSRYQSPAVGDGYILPVGGEGAAYKSGEHGRRPATTNRDTRELRYLAMHDNPVYENDENV